LIPQKYLNINLPVNSKNETAKLFVNQQKYKLKNLRVKILKNVFVSHYGLCLKNFLLVPGCAPNLTGSGDKTFYFKFWWLTIEQYLVCKYGKSLKSVNLDDDKKYLLIHSKWFGYFFWITQCLPRLLSVRQNLSEYTLIFPEGWENLRFVNESLRLFPELHKIVIPSDYHIFVRNLILPEVQPWTSCFNPEDIEKVRNIFHDHLEKNAIDLNLGEYIYATRQNTKHRKLVNETEVQNLLADYNFKVIDFENYSFPEQVSIMKHARVFASIHGAGFANISFMNKGNSTLEFVNEQYAKKDYRFQFWKLSSMSGLNHYIQFCRSENDPEIPIFVNNNIYVDLNELKSNIDLIFKNLNK
jgi:hypothetical protein